MRLNEILAAQCGAIACCGVREPERYEAEQHHRTAFGDAVKETYMRAFGVDRKFVEAWKRNDDPPEGYEETVRKSLMFIGDGFRRIKPSVWIDVLFRNHKGKNIVISDGRYYSEVDAVTKRKGINIAMWRPGHENDIDHPSESQLKPEIDRLAKAMPQGGPIEIESKFDWFLVNDGDLSDLQSKIDSHLISFIEEKI